MSDDLLARIALLEQHVDWLYANAGQQGPYRTQYSAPQRPRYPVSDAVVERILAGKVIDAVKQHRAETAVGLAEAKHAVDTTRALLAAEGR